VLLDLLAAPPAAVAQASDQQLFVSVVDRKGLPITDLAPEEISVQEDGVTCAVRFLMPPAEPADLAILVDTSGAVVSATAHIREGLHEFVGMLEGQARMSLMTFGDLPRRQVAPTFNADRVRDTASAGCSRRPTASTRCRMRWSRQSSISGTASRPGRPSW
jgi:hypothetical protein